MTIGDRNRSQPRGAGEQGQILVIFALSITALLGFAGLAIDGGSTFAQQRDQQTACDLAALAAANDFLINGDPVLATERARDVADSNGYNNGDGDTTVQVTINADAGASVRVSISAPHHNTMAAVMGMPTWTVTTSGTALAGFPDTAYGASPFIFPVGAFSENGTPMFTTPTDFGETNGDVPVGQRDFAWTNYGTGNVNTTDVRHIIDGSLVIDKTLTFGEYIGQQNSGFHSELFSDVNERLSNLDVPAAIVDANGNFAGWATFHVISADGGSSKSVRGYFVTSFESARLGITTCAVNHCPRYLGSYVLKLTD